jgi:uncharacterized protein
MKTFPIMARPHGLICNPDCRYSYYLANENLHAESGREFRTYENVLETCLRQNIQAQPAQQMNFVRQGGEPTLLRIPFFKRAAEMQKEICQRQHRRQRLPEQRNAAPRCLE